ncbi:MAG: clostripain-related cysteine peptidase [Thermoanaerobaculia bacterium]
MQFSTVRRGFLGLAVFAVAALSLPLSAATPAAAPAARPSAASLVKKQAAPKPKSYPKPVVEKKLAKSKGAVAERDWTLMYYLDADCNLEPDMLDDMDELESIGSTDNVNILVLLDRTPEHDRRDGDWANARLLYVTRDATNGKLKSKVLDNLKETDTSDPRTLVGFVAFGMQNFPAKHYALTLGNHGGTWMGMLNDDTDNQGGMKLAPFIQGLEALKNAGAPKFDILAFDMCLMAQVEVMDAIAPYASFGVASEELEPGAGYPNHRVIAAITKNPKMSPRDFAQTMVREWGASYAEAGEAMVTSSATDLSKVKDLTTAVDSLATALAQAPGPVQAAAAKARAATHYYGGEDGGGDIASFDLGEFAARLAKQPDAAPIKSQLAAVQAAVQAAVVEHKEGAAHVGSTGLAIYFPAGQKIDPGYASLPFVRGQWDEFLAKGIVAGASGGAAGSSAGGGAGQASMSVAISSPDPSATHPIGDGLQVTAQVKGNPASIRAAIGYRDADGSCTKVSEEEVPGNGGWQDGATFTYTVRPKVRAVSDGKSSRLVPMTPISPGSRFVRADASYNSMRGDQKVSTIFDNKTGKLESIFCESEKGVRAPMAVHPVKGEKLVFYQPTLDKDKKTQRFRPVPALVASGGSAGGKNGKAKKDGDDLKLVDSGLPAGAYVLTLTAYDGAGRPSGGAELKITAAGAAGGSGAGGAGGGAASGGSAGGTPLAPGLAYPNYGYPALSEDDLDYIDLTQIIPADEYDHFEATWTDYNFMAEYQVDDFTAADLAYLEAVALDAAQLEFDREDWSDEFDLYSLEHPGDADGDGTPDATDLDDDGDGTADIEDLDDDDDGDPDAEDDDDDNDGLDDDVDTDDDGDGTPDETDLDDDNDGTADTDEDDDADDDDAEESDEDDDGTPDDEDADDDNDGTSDDADLDDDNDGTPDTEDADDDNDGTSDAEESDEDDDGTPDDEDADDDNDGTPDDADSDDDNDGTADDADTDDDNDGTSDEDEAEDDGGDDEAEDDGGEDEAEDDGGDDEAEDDGGDDEAEDDGGDDEAEDDGGDEGDDGGGDDGGDDEGE